MKTAYLHRRVIFSGYSNTITILSFIILAACIIISRSGNMWMWAVWAAALAVLCITAAIYRPSAIILADNTLNVKRLIWTTRIPVDTIQSVDLCQPTMGAKRIAGSNGFAGYWGWFSERDLGKYFAYYGKASDCFLVTLKNGRKYMLGCEDAPLMVETLKSLIAKR